MTSSFSDFRRERISRPVLERVRKALPRMSDTEREALSAGTVWWEAELLSGNPDLKALLAMGTQTLTTEEQAFLDGPTETLCRMLDDWKITFEDRDISDEIWDYLKVQGFLGLIIPRAHGGKEFSATAISAIVCRVSSVSSSAAVAIIVPNSLGPGELLHLFGTDEQKKHYLPRLADGRDIPAFALTSIDAGSDATAMTDRGVVCYGTHDGKKTLGIKVTWSKRYISLGPICTLLGLAFKLEDPDGLMGDRRDVGITLALVPADTAGIEIGRRHYPGMQAFPNGPNSGTDVFIPMDWIIGGRERAGQGWRMLVTALAAGRGIMLPAMAMAGMKVAAFSTGAYARIRQQFSIAIAEFEGIQEPMARIAGNTYRIDAARRLTALAVDRGEKPAIVSAIMKYHATEAMRAATNDAMDVHAGKAVCDGPKNYLGSGYRAMPIAITVEGANIMTRSLMIYGQGSIRCHPYLQTEMAAAQNEDREAGLEAFDKTLFAHAGYQALTLGRAFIRGWSMGLLSSSPVRAPTAGYYRQIKRLSALLALVSEVALVSLGGRLKRMELISARLGDALSELYLAAATLKRFDDEGRQIGDLALVRHAAETSLHNADRALGLVLDNFPVFLAGPLIKLIARPFGLVSRPPSDKLIGEVSNMVTRLNSTRERLCEGIHVGGDERELGRLDAAFRAVSALEPIMAKMKSAKVRDVERALATKIISADEAKRIADADRLVKIVLAVDDFAPDDLLGTDDKAKTPKPQAARKPAGSTAAKASGMPAKKKPARTSAKPAKPAEDAARKETGTSQAPKKPGHMDADAPSTS